MDTNQATAENAPAVQMPRYKCHKEVRALKINEVTIMDGGHVRLSFEGDRFAPMIESPEFNQKHHPHPGGYLVVYADGYRSFSPAKAFEEGYTLVEGAQ